MVDAKRRSVAESHPALGTRVRPFARVGSQMTSEVGHPWECFTTFRTLEWPDSCMYEFVTPQTPHIMKCTSTVFADARLLASMNAFVYRQALKCREVLATVSAQIATVLANGFVDTHLGFLLLLMAAMWSETPDSSKALTALSTANLSIFTLRG